MMDFEFDIQDSDRGRTLQVHASGVRVQHDRRDGEYVSASIVLVKTGEPPRRVHLISGLHIKPDLLTGAVTHRALTTGGELDAETLDQIFLQIALKKLQPAEDLSPGDQRTWDGLSEVLSESTELTGTQAEAVANNVEVQGYVASLTADKMNEVARSLNERAVFHRLYGHPEVADALHTEALAVIDEAERISGLRRG